jgi:hypothetical protein
MAAIRIRWPVRLARTVPGAGCLDWHLLDYPEHAGVQALVRALNTVYRSEQAL